MNTTDRQPLALVVGLLSAFLWTQPAGAVDGVIEINQDRALAGAVTTGDAPGFPVTLDQAGSYRLTGILVLPDENTTGVEIAAGNVTLDLNGFAILGVVICTASPLPVSCDPVGGSGRGVRGLTSAFQTAVVNGSIRGMGSGGIRLQGAGHRVRGIRVTSNAGTGIYAGSRSEVSGSTVYSNGTGGIDAGAGSHVSANTAHNNGGVGLLVHGGSVVRGNSVIQNGGVGIFANAGSLVLGNAAHGNGGVGLRAFTNVGYADNVFTDNNGGTGNPQVVLGIELGTNLCDTDTNCP